MELVSVYIDLRPTLVRYFSAKTGSVSAAEDIVQEIYVKICSERNAADIRDPKAWMFRVGANLFIDARRRAQRETAREQIWASEGDGEASDLTSRDPSPETIVADRQRLARLLRLVDEMPPRMAEAFRLHKLQGLSQAEAAHRMGISTKAVEKHLTSGLRRLAETSDRWM